MADRCVWFLELEGKLGLFCQNHFMIPLPYPTAEEFFLIHIFIFGGELRALRFCFAKFEFSPCGLATRASRHHFNS